MTGARAYLVSIVSLSCGHPAFDPIPIPHTGPAVIVVSNEALIVFPADIANDFPWGPQVLSDAFAGPYWALDPYWSTGIAASRRPDLGLAVTFWRVDSLRMDAVESLAEVVARAAVYRCTLNEWVVACGAPMRAEASVGHNRLIVRVTDRRWLNDFLTARPERARLRVLRPNRREHSAHDLAIQYPGGG